MKKGQSDIKAGGGFYYENQVWFSEAYQSLRKSAMNLLQCLVTELRWTGKGKKRMYTNNGEVSYTETQFTKQFGYQKETYLKARNKLIKVGLIKQTYRGGMGRGDMSKYKILFTKGLPYQEQRWCDYPSENWSHEIPKVKKAVVGKDSQ